MVIALTLGKFRHHIRGKQIERTARLLVAQTSPRKRKHQVVAGGLLEVTGDSLAHSCRRTYDRGVAIARAIQIVGEHRREGPVITPELHDVLIVDLIRRPRDLFGFTIGIRDEEVAHRSYYRLRNMRIQIIVTVPKLIAQMTLDMCAT